MVVVEVEAWGGISYAWSQSENSSYYVRPPHCAEFLPAAIHAKSSRPPSPCLLKVTATGISCGCIN